MDFGKWAFQNKNLVQFLIWVLIIGGMFSYYLLPKLEDPELKVRQAMVVGVYPGASAYEVELELADPLEKSIRQMPNINSVQSQCMNDMCLMTVELLSTVKNEELEQHWDILRRKVGGVSLPAGVSTVQVKDDFGDVFGMFYALTGDGLSDKELSDYAEYIKRELMCVEGVKRIDIYGKRSECINVTLHQDKMASMGVLPLEVIQTLNGQSSTVYGGYFMNGTNRVRVTVGDRTTSTEDIANLIIQGHEDDQLRIRDLAEVTKEYKEPVRNAMKYDGENALGICISAASGVDVTKLGRVVDKRMDELKHTLPVGVEYNKIFYQPERVSDALNNFIVNLIESVLLVVVVLIFFMGLRSGMIIGYSLLVIVLGTILILMGLDGTLQRVSLASFILAMGMLVDNAIVIVDGILVDSKRGLSRQEALTRIGNKTSMPLLGATLIAILAFLPIFMSPDTTGLYVRDLFIVMAVSLLLSWILALVDVPLKCEKYLFGKKEKAEIEKAQAALADGTSQGEDYSGMGYRILRSTLNVMLGHKVSTVVLAIALLAVSGMCYKFLPQAFFPDMEYDQLYMEYKLPEGRDYKQVQRDLDLLQTYLRTRPEIKHIVCSTGGTPSRYNLVRSIATPSLAYGELIIDFESPQALVENIDELQQKVGEMFPDAYVKFKRYNLMYKKYPIEAQFTGPDPAVLHQLSDSCIRIMERSGKVRCITTDWEPKIPVLEVNYNQMNARRLNLSRTAVGMSLLAATDGIPVGSFYEGIHQQTIEVKCVNKDGEPLEFLEDASVFGILPNVHPLLDQGNIVGLASGHVDKSELLGQVTATTPLRQVSDGVEVKWDDPVVMRYNGQRAQRVQCTAALGMGTEQARSEVEELLNEQLVLPEGYKLDWIGERAASKASMKYLFNNYPLAVILMIAILIMLFKDFKAPMLIFCSVPFILIGVIPAVLISGKTFGFVAIVGVLGLVGMMIKNCIVLLDEINLQISEGKEPKQALLDSSLSRLRPVSMAAVTTILGMIPLLPDAMFGPMAATIMGGLLVGTILVLTFFPVLYALFYKVK